MVTFLIFCPLLPNSDEYELKWYEDIFIIFLLPIIILISIAMAVMEDIKDKKNKKRR